MFGVHVCLSLVHLSVSRRVWRGSLCRDRDTTETYRDTTVTYRDTTETGRVRHTVQLALTRKIALLISVSLSTWYCYVCMRHSGGGVRVLACVCWRACAGVRVMQRGVRVIDREEACVSWIEP